MYLPIRRTKSGTPGWQHTYGLARLLGLLLLLLSLLASQDQGLSLHVRKAGLQWTSDAPASTLWSALLLHDLSVSPGA